MTDRQHGRTSQASQKAESVGEQLNLSQESICQAVELAYRAEIEHPINRAPSSISAASVHLAALLNNELKTQKAVADAAGVHENTLSEVYAEMLEYEGYND